MNRTMSRAIGLLVAAWAVAALAAEPAAPTPPQGPTDLDVLTKALTTPLKLLRGKMPAFTVTLEARFAESEKKPQTGSLTLTRDTGGRFALSLVMEGLSAQLVREVDETLLVVPPRQVALVGKGPMPGSSPLDLDTVLKRLVAIEPRAAGFANLMLAAEPGALALILQQFGQLNRVPPDPGSTAPPTFRAKREVSNGHITIQATPDGASIGQLAWTGPNRTATVRVQIAAEARMPRPSTDGLKIVAVPRPELELALGRALVRAVEILAHNNRSRRWKEQTRHCDAGRLMIKKRSKVAVLDGKAYQIGFQHGKLLARGARRLCDSTLYCVGIAYSVEKKKWFLDVMRGAWKRLRPHIPVGYLEEMRGLADGVRSAGVQVSLEEVQLANVFPALFHCSGFAILPKATKTGNLYHGRVLDYMTEVGLQYDAVVFVVRKRRAIAFVNVGYAGFIGSVTGMNARRICFGEMGGSGEGQWDGTPMPILMRMGLEGARSLHDAMRIFREAKRTCEYYYVISDANIPDAVGVKATPEAIEFIKPGEAHPQLPTPVDHCILMSAGRRYTELVKRVKAGYGKFDALAARMLMSRPVAMRSNLHNALFVPSIFRVYVADARGTSPAYRRHYIRHDVGELLRPKRRPIPIKRRPTFR